MGIPAGLGLPRDLFGPATPGWIALIAAAVSIVGSMAYALYYAAQIRNTNVQIEKAKAEIAHIGKEGQRRDQELQITLESLRATTMQVQLQTTSLLVQQRRLAEHNLSVEATVDFVYRDRVFESPRRADGLAVSVDEGFVVMRLTIKNIGDSPVDLLGCMAAGRELSNVGGKGVEMGAVGRDVRWEDLPHFYWYEPQSGVRTGPDEGRLTTSTASLFRGLSTTKNLPYSRYQLIRLDPGESEVLNRIDYITDLTQFLGRGHVNFVYKLFTVALGYPLADIASQLDLPMTGPESPGGFGPLYAQELARPDFRRWARIQRALFLINRFAFRLALQGREIQDGKEINAYRSLDPLGRLSEPTAFRCFLLHHWDFIEENGAQPNGAPDPVGDKRRAAEQAGQHIPTTDELRQYLQENMGFIDSTRSTEASYRQARDYCRDTLKLLTDAWIRLDEAIARCHAPGFNFDDLIQTDEYRPRWEALRREGYLFTQAFSTSKKREESTAIERFAMRTKYVQVTVARPHSAQHLEP